MKKPGRVFLTGVDEGIVSWDVGKPELDSFTMEPAGDKPVRLPSDIVWICVEQMCFLLNQGGEF